jgi:pilus assembly protein Flp/PilA
MLSARRPWSDCRRVELAGAKRPSGNFGGNMSKWIMRLARDERGGEVLEYALIMGLIVVVAIAVIGTVGTKVLARWTSVNSSL